MEVDAPPSAIASSSPAPDAAPPTAEPATDAPEEPPETAIYRVFRRRYPDASSLRRDAFARAGCSEDIVDAVEEDELYARDAEPLRLDERGEIAQRGGEAIAITLDSTAFPALRLICTITDEQCVIVHNGVVPSATSFIIRRNDRLRVGCCLLVFDFGNNTSDSSLEHLEAIVIAALQRISDKLGSHVFVTVKDLIYAMESLDSDLKQRSLDEFDISAYHKAMADKVRKIVNRHPKVEVERAAKKLRVKLFV